MHRVHDGVRLGAFSDESTRARTERGDQVLVLFEGGGNIRDLRTNPRITNAAASAVSVSPPSVAAVSNGVACCG
jgi:hypothetical protein